MALTISTGFVVDDAIVMIENIARYVEAGERPLEGALKGAEQIGLTIVSLTVSLIAVLIPLLFMSDIVGRLFREFAVTLSVTISTGFVVDDAIVVLENIARHLNDATTPFEAALTGVREVGFTVLSMSLSLVVFIPLLFMGGLVGRLFREFAVTLSVAVAVSLVISLTTTPMLCARFLRRTSGNDDGSMTEGASGQRARWSERAFERVQAGYDRTLDWALTHAGLTPRCCC